MADDGGIRVMEDDILIEILLLLPAKSLARCKSVCKTWYNFIKTPNFFANFINRSHNHNHNSLLAISNEWFDYERDNVENPTVFCSILNESESLSVRKIITDNPIISNCFPFTSINRILGPVNGLYCIVWHHSQFKQNSDYEEFTALWNPFTTEFRQLEYPSFLGITSLGVVGFGSSDEDIKLVCITRDDNANADESFCSVVLYSLARDCWRKIKSDIYLGSFVFGYVESSAYVNGCYYWITDEMKGESSCHAFVFDMRAEVFRSMPFYGYGDKCSGMLVRNDSLVFLVEQWSSTDEHNFYDVDSVDVLEMKEEGCLKKIFSYLPLYNYDSRPLLFWKDDEIIFRTFDDNDKLLSYNIRSTQSRNLDIDEKFCILDYKESLTSVKGGTGLMQVL